jgi:subtilisin family serine protease
MAICIGVDTSQSSHDGRGTLSSQVSLYAVIEGIAIILPAGNEGNARRHYFGTIEKEIGFNTVELNVGVNEPGFSMELWGQRPNFFSVDITSPSGEYIPRLYINRDEFREITFIFERTVIYIDYQMVESQSGDQLILFRFNKPAPGIWKFNVYKRGDLTTGFHIWLPKSGFISDNTFFINPNPYTTILTVGNALVPITATAYNPIDDSLFAAASRGYTRLGEIKPDIAAPGVDIIGPTLDKTFTTYTGTSVAAAHTVGIAALLLEWGIVKGNLTTMSTIIIKRLMIRGARRELDIVYPNRDWGYGIVDIYNVFDSLRTGFMV